MRLWNEYIISKLCNRPTIPPFQSKFKQSVNQDIYDFLYSHHLSIGPYVHFVKRSYNLITLEYKGFQNQETILPGRCCRWYTGFLRQCEQNFTVNSIYSGETKLVLINLFTFSSHANYRWLVSPLSRSKFQRFFDFSNPLFFEPPRTKSRFRLFSRTLQFYPRFPNWPNFQTNLSLLWRMDILGFYCSCQLCTL